MRNRKDGSYKVNPLGVNITGCPLEEKISEMHLVKRQGDNIGALALIVYRRGGSHPSNGPSSTSMLERRKRGHYTLKAITKII